MLKCYLCDKESKESNKSNEHIIPEALGGKIYSDKLLCEGCNNGLGSRIDKGLTDQVGYLYDLLETSLGKASNASNKIYGASESGEFIEFNKDLKPYCIATIKIKDIPPFTIKKSNEEDLRKAVKKKIKEIERKYPNLDIDIENIDFEDKYITEKVFFKNKISDNLRLNVVGGDSFFRGFIKIAINYYLYINGEVEDINDIIKEIKLYDNLNRKVNFFYTNLCEIHKIGDNEVSHLIYLRGDTNLKLLYAYIELFNTHNVIVLLNDNYLGKEINTYYCFDLISNKKMEKTINLPIKIREHITDYIKVEDTYRQKNRLHQEKYNILRHKIDNMLRAKNLIK